MTDPDPSIAVQIRPGNPLTGRMTTPDGDVSEFRGWLGLATALEQALRSVAETNPPEGDPSC